MGKIGNTAYQHFLLFPMFSKALKFFFRVNHGQDFVLKGKRMENVKENGENAGYQHFLPFLQCFQMAFSSGWLTLSQAKNFRLF